MKIVYFITTSSWGGASEHVYELCKFESMRNNKVTLITGSTGLLLNKVKKIANIDTIVLKHLKRNISPINDFRSIYDLRKILKEIQPDILHMHSSKAGVIGRIAAYGLDIKTIFTVHGWAFTDGLPSKVKRVFYKNIERIVAPLTDLFICVSKYDRKIGIRNSVITQGNVKVIYNGVSNKNIVLTLRKCNLIKFVMVARFSLQKDQESLIKALKGIDKKLYKVTFVGDGKTLAMMKKLVLKLDLQKNVKFLGFKEDVISILKKNDIFVLSTNYEGLPISIIEAMMCRMPIIATNVGGINELVVNHKNGLLTNDVTDLHNAILYFIKHPRMISKMGEKSLILYKEKFTLEKCLRKVDNVYQKLLVR